MPRPTPRSPSLAEDDLVWYVAYGSNLQAARFGCYLAGGRPPGARREYAGCRDTTPWRAAAPVTVPGRLCFGGVSPTWGGGLALLDADADGQTRGRAYLLTAGQLRDVAAQEARIAVGSGPTLTREAAGSPSTRLISPSKAWKPPSWLPVTLEPTQLTVEPSANV